MLLSYFILKQKYRLTQCLGAVIIMVGIFVVLLPQIFPSCPLFRKERDVDNGGGEVGQDDTSDLPLFNLLFVISVIPGALSSIYKELAFAKEDIDANYLQAWVSLWQTLFGFLLIPLNTLSFLGPQAVKWNQLLSSFVDGMWCLFGYNLIRPPHCSMHHVPASSRPVCDDCEGSWIPIMLYVVFNVLFNVFTVLLIKYGSATLMFIIMTLRMPLLQLAFSWRVFNDPPDTFGWAAGGGLVIILVGLGCYRYSPKKKKKQATTLEKDTEGEMGAETLLLLPGATPTTLQRAKTTGSIDSTVSPYDLDDDELHMIIPVFGCSTHLFVTRHHEGRVRLARSASQIREGYLGKLGFESPQITRSPNRSPSVPDHHTNSASTAQSPLLAPASTRSRAHTPEPVTHKNYGSMERESKR